MTVQVQVNCLDVQIKIVLSITAKSHRTVTCQQCNYSDLFRTEQSVTHKEMFLQSKKNKKQNYPSL